MDFAFPAIPISPILSPRRQSKTYSERTLPEGGYGIDLKVDTSDMSDEDIEQLNEGIAALFEELGVDFSVTENSDT